MKNLVIILIGFLPVLGFTQTEEVVINKNIQALRISAGIQVELTTNAKVNKIEADKRVLEAINYKVSDYELKIGLSLETIFDGDFPLKLKVYTKNIDRLNAVQGSTVEIQNLIKTDRFFVRATEGSIVSGEFKTQSLELKALSGGIIDISGKSKDQDVLVNTGGEYKGKKLKTENTTVKVTYGGNAVVFVTENCEAKIVVGGNIDVYGNPKYVNEKTTFGGKVNIFKD
ncbi:head GIN domain-containing protein [Flavobacterium sp. CS20]|uniref:head GIN domain-containing protein n=1 Tax=Flavobacterium sp. CS20 TaxID=2775246 RepID=UPI001B3A5804|nr:head GIN domain-containing protein [Flavobacterium sp. CS20]QTY26789.1 DUF2807 domain-containing protein [Flavobacterium sp. CS20]